VQNSIATIIVLLAALVGFVFLAHGCEDEYRGWPSDAHSFVHAK
jgi:hypothetical protein